MSNVVATVTGDNNVVTINNIASLVNDYEEVKREKDDISDLNA